MRLYMASRQRLSIAALVNHVRRAYAHRAAIAWWLPRCAASILLVREEKKALRAAF